MRKCLDAGFTYVALVVPEQRRTASFEKTLRKVLSETEFARVRVVTPEGLFAFIEELDAKDATRSETIRGYKVKVSHHPVDQSTKEQRRAMLTKVVAESLKRKKK